MPELVGHAVWLFLKINKQRSFMKFNSFVLFILIVCVLIGLSGCTAVTLKQLSRNNLNQETVDQIKLCETTSEEIISMFRKPTEDYTRQQDEYTIFTYKGFGGRFEVDRQTLEVMLNSDDIVVDVRLNEEDAGSMTDQCLK
jgi:hypothetical protein